MASTDTPLHFLHPALFSSSLPTYNNSPFPLPQPQPLPRRRASADTNSKSTRKAKRAGSVPPYAGSSSTSTSTFYAPKQKSPRAHAKESRAAEKARKRRSADACDVAHLLDPSYLPKAHAARRAASVSAYVDTAGDMHDPDYRHFPLLAPAASPSHAHGATHAKPHSSAAGSSAGAAGLKRRTTSPRPTFDWELALDEGALADEYPPSPVSAYSHHSHSHSPVHSRYSPSAYSPAKYSPTSRPSAVLLPTYAAYPYAPTAITTTTTTPNMNLKQQQQQRARDRDGSFSTAASGSTSATGTGSGTTHHASPTGTASTLPTSCSEGSPARASAKRLSYDGYGMRGQHDEEDDEVESPFADADRESTAFQRALAAEMERERALLMRAEGEGRRRCRVVGAGMGMGMGAGVVVGGRVMGLGSSGKEKEKEKERDRKRHAEVDARPAYPDEEDDEEEERVGVKEKTKAKGEEKTKEKGEYVPTCGQSLRREWQAFALRVRFGVFRARRRVERRVQSML